MSEWRETRLTDLPIELLEEIARWIFQEVRIVLRNVTSWSPNPLYMGYRLMPTVKNALYFSCTCKRMAQLQTSAGIRVIVNAPKFAKRKVNAVTKDPRLHERLWNVVWHPELTGPYRCSYISEGMDVMMKAVAVYRETKRMKIAKRALATEQRRRRTAELQSWKKDVNKFEN